MNIITENFKFNTEYIAEHTLSDDLIAGALSKTDYIKTDSEIFVELPDYQEYYVSQFGAIISLKRKT